jgi:molecular chaperone DnaK
MATRFLPIKNLKEAHKAQNIAEIDSASAALNAAWTAASEDIYKSQGGAADAAGAQGQPGAGEGASSGADNVTDVPYEEVK